VDLVGIARCEISESLKIPDQVARSIGFDQLGVLPNIPALFCHTPLLCEVRKATMPRHERAVFTFKVGRMLVASSSVVVGLGFRSR
jgi:hypothetical protein